MNSRWFSPQRALDRSLDDVGLPARIVNLADGRGIRTLREFLVHPPSAFLTERNIGKKTLADTDRAITRALGRSWHDAWSDFAGPATRASVPLPSGPNEDTLPARWAKLALYPRLAEVSVRELPLPTRMKNHAERHGLRSAAELAACSWHALLASEGVGRGTLQKALEVLEDNLSPQRADRLAAARSWRVALQVLLDELSGKERLVASRRAGMVGEVPTLTQLGAELMLSRERVRQIEERATQKLCDRLSRSAQRERLVQLVQDPWIAWSALADDFFAAEPEDEPALSKYLAALDVGVRVQRIGERMYATRLSEGAVRQLAATAEEIPSRLRFPLPRASLVPTVAEVMACTRAHAEALSGLIEARFHEHDGVLNGFGARREDVVLAYLRARGVPTHRSELENATGRGDWPEEVVQIDRGMLTLRERVPDWQRWVQRAGMLAAATMHAQGPDRSWTTHELLPALTERARLPTWFNAWSLGSLLKEAQGVRYLGRNLVALDGDAGARALLFDAARQVLEQRGPVPAQQVLEATPGLTEAAWSVLRERAPFVLLSDDRVGLSPRDVPGGQEAIDEVVQAVDAALHEEKMGWESGELVRFVRERPGPAAGWHADLLRSVLRLSGGFRFTQSGAIGLAEWESARVTTQTQLASLPHEPTSAEVRASLLERWLISLPESCSERARELTLAPGTPTDTEHAAWATSLRARVLPNDEQAHVEHLLAEAEALRAREVPARLALFVSTALRYVYEAAQRFEERIGAFDDDEAVLIATRDMLDRLR